MSENEAKFLMRARPLTAAMLVIGLCLYGGLNTVLILKHGIPDQPVEWAIIGWGYLMTAASFWAPWMTWRARKQYPQIKTGYE